MHMGMDKGNWLVLCLVVLLLGGPALAEGDEKQKEGAQVYDLGEVIVTEKGYVTNLATTVTEVTQKDIKLRGAQTAAEALEQLPGVDVASGGKGEWRVSVRGFTQRQVKLLIDGVPAHESYYSTVDLSMIPGGCDIKNYRHQRGYLGSLWPEYHGRCD